MDRAQPLFQNDAIVLGILMTIIAVIFTTAASKNRFCRKFYRYVPTVLLCYFVPSIFATLNIISGEESRLYFVASRYLLPACMILLCLSVDLKEIIKLGPKALIMFFAATVGIILGAPIAYLIIKFTYPVILVGEGQDAIWRGMTTIAGSWIGGGANQTAMKEVFLVGDKVFSMMVAVDVIVASLWMAVLLFFSPHADIIDKKTGADNSSIKRLQVKIEDYHRQIAKIPDFTDTVLILAFGFGGTAIAHFIGNNISQWIGVHAPSLARFSLTSSFFWLIVISTAIGVALSFTNARKLEGAGASRIGSVFLYVLVATIGMKMNIMAIFTNPGLFVLGIIWIMIHVILLLVVAKLIKAPLFFVAVGSQANIGGAASAPIVAAAFHPTLASVGVLLAVLGYVIGTFGAWVCGIILQTIA